MCRTTDLALDESCGINGTCKGGLGCVGGRCVRVGLSGQPCSFGTCFDGMCRMSDGGYTGTCGALGATGEACLGSSGLSGNPCGAGLECRNSTCQTGCP